MDRLEEHIKNNREDLDRDSPPAGIWRRIRKELKKKKVNLQTGLIEEAELEALPEKEIICGKCGIVAKSMTEYCLHLQAEYDAHAKAADWEPGEQPDLPGMPPKDDITILGEDILSLKSHITVERDKLAMLNQKMVSELHRLQKDFIEVGGFVFKVELQDKLTVKPKKNKGVKI